MTRSALAACLVLALAGCGTTVPPSASPPGAPASTSGPPSGLLLAAPDPQRSPAGPGAVGAEQVELAAPGPVHVATSAAERPAGRSVVTGDRREVLRVGLAVDEAGRKQLKAIGVDVDSGDPVRVARVVEQVLNERGGVAGRPLEIVTWSYDGTGPAYPEALCRHFTEDTRVFTVLQLSATGPTTRACFRKHGMPVLETVSSEVSRDEMRAHSDRYLVAGVSLERLGALLSDGLSDAGFFVPGEPVGVVTYDTPVYHRVVREVVAARMRARGHLLREVVYLTHPGVDRSKTTAEASSAVLRFKQRGVRRVVVLEGVPWAAASFTAAAESQEARFSYGLATLSGPGMQLAGGKHALDERALRRATVLGWHPLVDLPFAHGVRALPPGAHAWRTALAQRGVRFEDECCAFGFALAIIERLQFLDAALRGRPATSAGLRDGVAALGTSFRSVLTPTTSFSAQQHDGAASYRLARWDGSCPCLRYRSPLRPLPR